MSRPARYLPGIQQDLRETDPEIEGAQGLRKGFGVGESSRRKG
jgi:hypothetical protein